MAGADGTRCCVQCGIGIGQQSGRGRPRKYCEACRARRTYHKVVGSVPRTCLHCGVGFVGRPDRNYCKPSCRNRAKRKRNPDRRRPMVVACHGCGITVQRPGRTLCKGSFVGAYHSRECYQAAIGRVATEAEALRRIGRNWASPRVNPLVQAEVAALRRIARYVERPRLTRRPCSRCGTPAIGIMEYSRRCKACAAEAYRQARRVAKAKRRSATRGRRTQNIDPVRVFERDHWRCHLCGCKTPKELRGTCDPRAPELDHIVTLADGGTHTWGNVACACRACNGAKSARSMGQLGLGFAA